MTRLTATRTFQVLFGKKKLKEKHFPASVSLDTGNGEISTGVQPPSLMRSKDGNDDDTSRKSTIDSESVKQDVTGIGRKRSGSLSKLVDAVRIPLRSRSISDAAPRTISSSSDTSLSLMGEWRDSDRQRLSSRTPSNVDSDMGGVDSTRSEASGDSDNQTMVEMDEVTYLCLDVRAGLAHLPPGVRMNDAIFDALCAVVEFGATYAELLTVIHEEMLPLVRRPSDPLADLLDPAYFRSASIERCYSALERGDVPDAFCQPFVLPNTSIITMPCPPSLSRRQTLRCWLTAAILFGAGLFFNGEAAILMKLMKHHSLMLDAFGAIRLLLPTWITIAATCCAMFFVFCFWTQVEWAYGRRSSAIVFSKRLLLI